MVKNMRTQPKKNLTIVNRYKGKRGNAVRIGYQNRILEKAPVFPKPLEYDDIDKAIFDFVDTLIPIVVDGKLIPTYTLIVINVFLNIHKCGNIVMKTEIYI